MRRRPINMMRGGRVPGYADGGEVEDIQRGLLGPSVIDAGKSAARYLAPNISSLIAGDRATPPPNFPDAPGKVPSWDDKRPTSAMMEGAEALSNFVGPGGGAKAAGAGAMAALPFIGSRSGRAAMEAAPKPKGITAYHGSPYDFDKFALEKIGTGEGAQAYGHGLYFAENEVVAKSYKETLGKNSGHLNDVFGSMQSHPSYDGLSRRDKGILSDVYDNYVGNTGYLEQAFISRLKEIEREFGPIKSKDALEKIINDIGPQKRAGHMYQVRLNAEPERFLDWDKPLGQQGAGARQAIERLWDEKKMGWKPDGKFAPVSEVMDGQSFYRNVPAVRYAIEREGADKWNRFSATDAKTYEEAVAMVGGDKNRVREIHNTTKEGSAQALREAGIPGIKYLDQGSRPKLWNGPQMERELDLAEQLLGEYRRMGNQKLIVEGESKIAKIKSEMASPGTNNYVVFDPGIIEILKKYGIMGPAGLGAAHMYEGPSQRASGGRTMRKQPRNMMKGGRVL